MWWRDTRRAERRTRELDVIFDAVCPWCFIAKRQLGRALDLLGEDAPPLVVRWRPFLLHPRTPAEGLDRTGSQAAAFGDAESAHQSDARVAEAGAAVGISFRHDLMTRVPSTVAAHRLIRLVGPCGSQDAVVEGVFRAYFEQGRDIGDPCVLADIADACGFDAAGVIAVLAGLEAEAEVLAEAEACRRAGVTGVPCFYLDGQFLVSGAAPAQTMAGMLREADTTLRHQEEARYA